MTQGAGMLASAESRPADVGGRGAAGSGERGDHGCEGWGPQDGPPAAAGIRGALRQTPSLVPLAERLALAAAHEVTVLLTGETGTGKTNLAALIHGHSPRRQHRLLVIPCGALSSSLIESELFVTCPRFLVQGVWE
jgi:hypothetical protein